MEAPQSALKAGMRKIHTAFTEMFGLDYPIVCAPMFLISNEDMVVEASEAGGLGSFPALNYRSIESYGEALRKIRARSSRPIGVNIIVNKSNTRQGQDLKIALDHGVEMFITSLGNPKQVISEAHKNGAKVFCDVTNIEHGKKVQDMGADGVIAVGAGAGGHAGPVSPLVLLPWLKGELSIPVLAAGGIGHGSQILACLALGADGVSVGTRFIASLESPASQDYKQAIINSTPEDIVLSTKISGTPASVINTDYIQKMGRDLSLPLRLLKDHRLTKKWAVPLIHWLGSKSLEQAAHKATWKTVWSAGQSVGMVEEVLSVAQIYRKMVEEFWQEHQRLEGLKG